MSSSDGFTTQTSLTVASIDVDLYKTSDTHPLTKTDITPAASGSSNDMAHVANGFYSLELTSANTDTAGRCVVTANISGALPVWHEFMVLPTAVYDAIIAGTGNLAVDAVKLSGDSGAADNAEAFFDGTGYAGTNNVIPTVTTVTNLTNAPTAGDLTATMKTSVTTAATAATPTAAAVTGAVGSVTAGVTLANNAVSAAAIAADAVAELIAAVFANDLEAGKTFAQAILDLWATNVGDATANDADDPTTTTFDSPDGSVQVTHALTGTTRAKL